MHFNFEYKNARTLNCPRFDEYNIAGLKIMELILTAPVSSAVGEPTEKLLSTLSVELAEAKPFELRDYQKDCIAQVLHMWRNWSACATPLRPDRLRQNRSSSASYQL